ncbi:MAG TPA: DUF5996 family protein [Pyrinomonadaceae bacterium]|jgi:hypothetical protein|nr:DUF5996 family protein [Pyrinomonadaceae bacterium]
MNHEQFPSLPLENWRPTKNTLHLYLQIVGKIRLKLFPRINHWWHVPLYVSPRGITTRPIPYHSGNFEIEFDLRDHVLRIKCDSGDHREFALHDGLTVAEFYGRVFENLNALGIEVKIWAVPYEAPSKTPFAEDMENMSYDKEYIERFHRILVSVNNIFEEFRGRFTGKSTPVHLFWHSFDLALTRFSGKPAKIREGAGMVEAEAYSHEVISFGFWAGDDKVPAPAFYSYAAPEPAGLADEKLQPDTAKWNEANGSHMAVLMYDDIREADDPRSKVLEFLDSTYQAAAKRADWDIGSFSLRKLK